MQLIRDAAPGTLVQEGYFEVDIDPKKLAKALRSVAKVKSMPKR